MLEDETLEALREKATRARRLACQTTDPQTVKSLTEYAESLDRDADDRERHRK
jgi:hypothetical protein